ncbi:MAG: hypothetical protein ACXAEX_19810 [Promethearchaeota archaeon]|jgi:hypothetical protein
MDNEEYKYNYIEKDVIFIKNELKQKGKEYGTVKLKKNSIYALIDSIDLLSVAPLVSI